MIPAAAAMSVALLDGPPGDSATGEWRTSVLSRLLEGGYSVRLVHHLPEPRDGWCVLSRDDRAISGAPGRGDLHNVAGLNPDEVVAFVSTRASQPESHPSGKRWKPWFPVIDQQRCTNCMQCLSFCLFDVYGVSKDGRLQVQNESNCKTDCPACSRVCPEVAIMFPKYKAGPINGDEVSSDDIRREAMKVDISALLGGDIYNLLRDRSAKAKSRFSLERDDDRALRERQRCLDKLQKDGGGIEIPQEVLASLPSTEEILAKAEVAKQRAAAALELRKTMSPPPAATESN